MTVVSIWDQETSGRQALRRQKCFEKRQSVRLVLCEMPVGGYYTLRKGDRTRVFSFLSVIPGWLSLQLSRISKRIIWSGTIQLDSLLYLIHQKEQNSK